MSGLCIGKDMFGRMYIIFNIKMHLGLGVYLIVGCICVVMGLLWLWLWIIGSMVDILRGSGYICSYLASHHSCSCCWEFVKWDMVCKVPHMYVMCFESWCVWWELLILSLHVCLGKTLEFCVMCLGLNWLSPLWRRRIYGSMMSDFCLMSLGCLFWGYVHMWRFIDVETGGGNYGGVHMSVFCMSVIHECTQYLLVFNVCVCVWYYEALVVGVWVCC